MILVEGGISVKACMLAGRRDIQEIQLDEARHDKDAHFIERKAEELHIALRKVKREEIDAVASGHTHGGVIAYVGERNYQSLEACMTGMPFILVVEGVEDPFNLGYIMRSAYAAGCTGIILRNRDWHHVENVILKSSAGASEYMNVVCSDDIPALIRQCKKQGIHTYAAMRKDAITYWEADYMEPVLVAIGGEMRGLSRHVLAEIETNIYIPYNNDFRAALNAAGATAAISFEIFRQRNERK